MRPQRQAKKPSKLRDRFKMLIDSLRQKQNFKDKINTSSLQQATQPSKAQLLKEIGDIVPVTQEKTVSAKSPVNSQSNSWRQQQQLRIYNNSSFAFVQHKSIQQIDGEVTQKIQIEHEQASIGLGKRLNPEIGLECPYHEGRIGTIKNQANSINARFRQKHAAQKSKEDQFRFSKLPKKSSFKQEILPSKVLKEKVQIKQLNDVEIVKFWNTSKKLNDNMSFNQYYAYFQEMTERFSINLTQPVLKKYKNCIYFGENTSQNRQYQGIIYYFDQKIYYGQFVNGVKHGHGIQINFKDNIKYAGNFNGGKKNGFFFVQKNEENYEGVLQHGLYHGTGKLMTQQYTYSGSFEDGKKHGCGQQYYPKTGLKLVGFFNNGSYQNLNEAKTKKAAVSQPQLQNKLGKVVSSSTRGQMVDFRIDLTTKLLKNRKKHSFQQVQYSNYPEITQVPFQAQDASSLSDLLSNNSRSNKYSFQASKITKRFPKIYIQGIKKSEMPSQSETKIIINKQSRAQYEQRSLSRRKNDTEEEKPISFVQKVGQFAQNDIPLLKNYKNKARW